MPKLIGLYIQQVAIGFGVSALFTAMLLYFNVSNLAYLVDNTREGPLAVFLLFMFNGILFAGVQFGIAIMRMAGTEEEDDEGGTSEHSTDREASPVRVRSETPRDKRPPR